MCRPSLRRVVPLLLPLAAALPASPALAGLDTSFTGANASAFAHSQQTFAVTTPHPGGGLDVSVGATASDSIDLGPLFSADFE